MGKGGGVDGCKGGVEGWTIWKIYPIYQKGGQTGQTGQSISKNVAVAWDVPLKTGPEKAPKCTKGFYRWRHSQVV